MNATAIALPKDSAVRGILFSNLLAIGFAVFDDAGLLMLLWPYWAQSVIIGFYAYRRIAKLQKFKTDGLKINGRSVDPTPETRSSTKNFFALHYGFFHVGYFIFLGAMTGRITRRGCDRVRTARGTRRSACSASGTSWWSACSH
jgi:hypothetical protein